MQRNELFNIANKDDKLVCRIPEYEMMDRLDEFRVLIAIVETGSLVAAGRRLGKSPPTMTRRLTELEQRIGVCLVERSSRTCRPTSAGVQLADQGRRVLESYEEAIAHASGEMTTPRGQIRMTAPITFGRNHVVPLVTDFIDKHPEIAIELTLIDRLVDLVEEELDLAVRVGFLSDSSLITRTVGELRRVFVASPSYLNAMGTPARPEDLPNHKVIHHTSRGANSPWMFRNDDGRSLRMSLKAGFTVNDPDAAIVTALNGGGIVSALSHQVDADLQTGRLVCVLEDFEPAALPVNLVWPRSRRALRRMRLLIDYLAQELSGLKVLGRSAEA